MQRFESTDLWCAAFAVALGVTPAAGCGDNTYQAPDDTNNAATNNATTNNAATNNSTTTSTNTTTGSVETPFPCVAPEPIVVDGQDTGYDRCEGGFLRRREVVACPNLLTGTGTCEAPYGFENCTSDAECDAGPYGRCNYYSGLEEYCGCNYGCITDDDCGDGQICLCGDPIGQCVQSSCTSDAGCEGGLMCTSYTRDPGCGGTAFQCQTADDTCGGDADCEGSDLCSTSGATHACQPQNCAIGRPFLVEGHERTADATERSDWCADAMEVVAEGLDDALRAALVEHWTKIGLMEHASVAAFARSALQLMSLGAPPELLLRTQAAMVDETKHARNCFALATAYAQRPIGPGPLSIEGALEDVALRDILDMVIQEGCIGETVAALEAVEALGSAQDPQVRAVLADIADDERAHALLAWDTVRWALATGDADLRAWLRDAFDHAIAAFAAEPPAPEGPFDDATLLRHGVVSDRLRGDLRRYVLRTLIRPCADALLSGTPTPEITPAPRSTTPSA